MFLNIKNKVKGNLIQMYNLYIKINFYIRKCWSMDKLEQITTLLKKNGINAVAKQLKIKKADIYNFLKNNGLVYEDGEVKPMTNNKNEMAVTKTNVIQKDNKSINNKPPENIVQKYNKDIDINTLNELISMIEPLREIIQKNNQSKNIIEIERKELKPKSITEFKQKLFKVDVDVLEDWNKFVADNKQYKVQNLVSMALEEFLEKYK